MKVELDANGNTGNAALLVIDVQRGLFQKATPVYDAEQLLDNLNTLIAGARGAGVPVLFVQHAGDKTLTEGTEAWCLHPRIQPLPMEPVVPKRHGNAFEGTRLRQELESRQVGTVVVVGLVTHGCVKATCLGAMDLGYRVILVSDGHSSFSKQAAKLTEQWNQKLSGLGIETRATREIDFRFGRER